MTEVDYREHTTGGPRSYVASASANGIVWACGQVPADAEGDIPEAIGDQVRVAFDNLERVLADAGSSLDRILKINVFLADLDEFDEFDHAYRERLAGSTLPPRTTVEVARFRGAKRIEVDAVAAVA